MPMPFSVLYKLYRGRRFQIMQELYNDQWLSTDELLAKCDERARRLATHAAMYVPYYQNIFKEMNLSPERMRIPQDWNRIPILHKELLRNNYDSLISRSEHSERSFINYSGGSTGSPVKFLSDINLHARMTGWLDFVSTWAGWRPGEARLNLWGGGKEKLPPNFLGKLRSRLSGGINIPVYDYSESDMNVWWQTLRCIKPTVIYGYPSVLADFASWLESEKLAPMGIKGVFSSAEILYPAQRRTIERVFGCKVFNQYGSRETPCVACECPEGGMHIFVNWNRVEFLGSDKDEDSHQEIIITPLFNYAQPLIRYKIGDLGRPLAENCSCGRGYPLMDLGLARSRDLLMGQDGKRHYPAFFAHLLDDMNWIREFQFVQEKEDEILLYVVPDVFEDMELKEKYLQNELGPEIKRKMGGGLKFNVCLVEQINRTEAGKYRYVINNIPKKTSS